VILVIIFCLFTTSTEASRKDEILKYIRSKVIREESYEFGTDREFTLQEDKTVLLKAGDNVDGISKILICMTKHFSNSQSIYILCVREQGINLGGWRTERVERTFRTIEKCAVIAEWSEEKQGLRLKLILTDDRKRLTQKFKEFWKQGRFANSGDWKSVIDEYESKLSVDERIKIFVKLWTEVKYNFANFDLVPQVNWDQVLKDKLPLVRQDQSNKDFAKLLVRCIAELKDGHTDISMKFCMIFHEAQPALVVKPIEGRAIITEIGNSNDVAKVNLKIGDEILKIDGKDVRELLEEEIYPYVFASTDQWRDIKAFRYLLRGPASSEINLRIKNAEGKQRNIVLTRDLGWGRNMPRKEHTDFEYRDLGDGISYVAINTFKTSEVVDEFRKHMDRIRGSKGLIIDVRENGGGNSGNGDRIVSLLIDKPILNSPWKTPQHIAAFQAWGRPEKWHIGEMDYVEPNEEMERFSGPIIALMGPESFSAAEDFLVLLHSSKRATLVGGKTGGSTGQPLRFKFDYGVDGRICTKRNTYPDGREFVGIGVIPDVEVHATRQSITEGKDIVLQRGIEVLKDKMAAIKIKAYSADTTTKTTTVNPP
jgi:C-terminal processing protease CtpA/Prc